MNLALTEEQEQLKAATRRLLETVCTKEWLDGVEAREEYPFELHQRMADMGLCLRLGAQRHRPGDGHSPPPLRSPRDARVKTRRR